MDGERFDTLIRTLTAAGSRRRALALAVSGALGLLAREDTDAHNPSKSCKKKSGKARKKCLKQAKRHNAAHATQGPPAGCTPNCNGKTCGANGCSGSCGTCTGGSACVNGTCVCPAGQELCKGACVPSCTQTNSVLDPTTCDCCLRYASECWTSGLRCCPGSCVPSGSGSICWGGNEGDPCEFNAQCRADFCLDGVCRCPSGQDLCGGVCQVQSCLQGWSRNPDTCACCVPNGSSCKFNPTRCCAGTNRCTGADNTTCVGLAPCDPCQFADQCANKQSGCNNGKCGHGCVIG
jgi:hypothetical protein